MARQSRFIIPGHPHLVIQRGHGGQPVFPGPDDARDYLLALAELARVHDVRVHAYGLRSDEVGLLATPVDLSGLSKLMQALARRHAQQVNSRHQRTGTPWQGRFCSAPVDPQTRVLEAMRLVEAVDPDHSSLVDASSEAHHIGTGRNALIVDHAAYWALGNTPFEREAAYRELAQRGIPEGMARNMRASVINGWPIGPATYLAALARETDRPAMPAPRGRPRRI